MSDVITQNLRSQIVTSSVHGGRRYLPFAFTEQGIAMIPQSCCAPHCHAARSRSIQK